MKKYLALATLAVALTLAHATPAAAAGPASYETAWTNDMNQTSYWADAFGWTCSKYSGHNGAIPAQYDAAIIKDGSAVVKVYPDLTQTGAFTATGAINPANGKPYAAPHSWVMKCTHPKPPPTTEPPVTTVPETTQPPTTLPPETTVPPTTAPPETTVPETTAPPTTAPETTTPETTAPPEVTTTAPPVVETSTPPTLPPAPTTPPPPAPRTPAPTQLPETGAETWIMALLGGLALAGGTGLVRLARRG